MTSCAILISGKGSNMLALLEAAKDRRLDAQVAFVAGDSEKAFGLTLAQKAGIKTYVLPYESSGKKEAENKLRTLCFSHKVDWLILAGFMRILSPEFVQEHMGRIVNIHPSLLPSFPGKSAIKDAWQAGAEETGVTVHIVDEGVDSGPILAQESVKISPNDTLESLEEKIHATEHALYWKTLTNLFREISSS